jgi:tetratricopeptide (TPR) repeat protein
MDKRVEALLERPLTIHQQVAVKASLLDRLATQGRMSEALALASELNKMAESFMIPLVRIMNVGARTATYHAQRGEWPRALKLMDEMALQVDPPMDGIVIFLKLGILEIADDRDQFREAMKEVVAFREQVEIPFLDPIIMRYQALIASWDGALDQALETHQQATRMMENSVLVLENPAVIYDFETQYAVFLNQAGRYPEAIDLLKSALKFNPVDPKAKLELVEILLQQKQYDAADTILAELFDLWAEADPEYLELQRAISLSEQIPE